MLTDIYTSGRDSQAIVALNEEGGGCGGLHYTRALAHTSRCGGSGNLQGSETERERAQARRVHISAHQGIRCHRRGLEHYELAFYAAPLSLRVAVVGYLYRPRERGRRRGRAYLKHGQKRHGAPSGAGNTDLDFHLTRHVQPTTYLTSNRGEGSRVRAFGWHEAREEGRRERELLALAGVRWVGFYAVRPYMWTTPFVLPSQHAHSQFTTSPLWRREKTAKDS